LLVGDNWKGEPRYLCESDYLSGDDKDNAHDFIFEEITQNPVEVLPTNAVLVGIEVTVRARTKLRAGAADTDDLVQRCYFSSVELRNGKEINSDNRGSDRISPRIPVDTEWTDVTVGDHRDLWDEFEDLAAFKLTPKIEIDMLTHWFDKKTLKSAHDHDDTDARCQVAGAKIRLHYIIQPDNKYQKLVIDGHETESASWWYFNPRDADGMGQGDLAPTNNWMAINFDPKDMHGWAEGKGPFGYGEEMVEENTRISSARLSAFFRTTFDFNGDLQNVSSVKITALIDDGAVVYLNGQPLWWYNFELEKFGLPKPEETATRLVFHEERQKTSIIPGHLLLVKGKNVLAAEVHQVHVDSSDLLFDFELTAVINKEIDESVLPPQTGNSVDRTNAPATPAAADGTGSVAATSRAATSKSGDVTAAPADTTSVLTTVVLAGAIIGLLLFFLYLAWQRFKGRRRAAASSRGSLSFAQYVPEDVQLEAEEREAPTKMTAMRPTLAATEPELKRPEFASETGAASTTGGGSGLGTVQKKKHAPEDWEDF
jgi:hypothetical protein